MTDPAPQKAAIRERIRVHLDRRIAVRGIPIAQLAKRSRVAKATIYRILDKEDQRDVQVGTLVQLCAVLRCDVRRLFEPLPGEVVVEGDGPLAEEGFPPAAS